MKVTITKRGKWQFLKIQDLKDIYEYRDLLMMLVLRDIKVIYKQTVLGLGWAVIKPLIQMIIFTIIFGKLAGIERFLDNDLPYPVFSYIALVPWTFFSAAINNATTSLVGGTEFITKVYFPRLIIPLTPIFAKLLDFVIAFSILILLLLYYGISPNVNILFIPIMIMLMMITAFGIGCWLSALAIQYRDINQMMQFGIQLLMYAAPVIWPISFVPEKFRLIYGLYPMVGVIEGFRAALVGSTEMPWDLIGTGFLSAIILFITGIIYFRNKENIFADVA